MESLSVEIVVKHIFRHLRDRKHPVVQTRRLNALICVAKWLKAIFTDYREWLVSVLGAPRPRFEPLSLAAGETQTCVAGICTDGQRQRLRVWACGRGPREFPSTLGTGGVMPRPYESTPVEVVADDMQEEVGDVAVECNGTATLMRAPGGRLFSWGFAGSGNLGYGDGERYGLAPRLVMTTERFRKVAAGVHHYAAIDAGQHLYAWGRNNVGQCACGLGETSPKTLLVPTPVLPEVQDVAVGLKHTLVATVHGEVYAFGSNCHGQLAGSSSLLACSVPKEVKGLPKLGVAGSLVGVYSNHFSSFVVYEKAIYAFGYAGTGGILGVDLGMPDVPQFFTRTNAWCVTIPTRVSVPELTDESWAGLATGLWHTVAWTNKGRAWGWGRFDLEGGVRMQTHAEPRDLAVMLRQVGKVVDVSVGNYHTVILDHEGRVATFGCNNFGQCGRKHDGWTDHGGVVAGGSTAAAAQPQQPLELDVHRVAEAA